MTLALFFEIFLLSLVGYVGCHLSCTTLQYNMNDNQRFVFTQIKCTYSFLFPDVKQGQLNPQHVLCKFGIYTSPTFGTSMINVVASLTFVIAVALRWSFTLREHVSLRLMRKRKLHEHHLISILCRLEGLDVRNARGIAKVLGTLISLAGVMTMTLYKGPEVQTWKGAPIHLSRSNSVHENWIKGPILACASCISWSLWYIRQVHNSYVQKNLPS